MRSPLRAHARPSAPLLALLLVACSSSGDDPATGAGPGATAESVSRFAYAVHDQVLSRYWVDPLSGELRHSGIENFFNEFTSEQIVDQLITPDGRFLIAATVLTSEVWVFAIDALTGSLDQVAGSPVDLAATGQIRTLALAAQVGALYVGFDGPNQVGVLNFDSADGSLAQGGTTLDVGSPVINLTVGPGDGQLYIESSQADGDAVVRHAVIDGQDGSLTLAEGTLFINSLASNIQSEDLLFTEDGLRGLVSVQSGLVSVRRDPQTGELAGVTALPTFAPSELALHPDGRTVFSKSSGFDELYVFDMDPETLEFTQVDVQLDLGFEVRDLALDPTGTRLYLAGATPGGGSDRQGQIAYFDFDPDAAEGQRLTQAGRIRTYGEVLELDLLVGTTAVTRRPVAAVTADRINRSVSSYRIAADGLLTDAPGTPFAIGGQLRSVAPDRLGEYVFVANESVGEVAVLRIDPNTAELSHVTAVNSTVGSPGSIAVGASGRLVFVGGVTDVGVYAFDRGSETLVPTGGPVPLGTGGPFQLAVDPTGRFLFAQGNNDLDRIVSARIDLDFDQLFFSDSIGLGGAELEDLTVDVTGQFLVASTNLPDEIRVYEIDPGSGALTLVDVEAAAVNNQAPRGSTVDPTGRFLYTSQKVNADGVVGHRLDKSGGDLSQLDPVLTETEDVDSVDVATALVGTRLFLYVLSEAGASVQTFEVDLLEGLPSPIPTAPLSPTGTGPVRIEVVERFE